MKLSDYAKERGLTYRTAWEHFRTGKIPNAVQDPITKNIYIKKLNEKSRLNRVALYARVSSHPQKQDLERQLQRLRDYSTAKGYQVTEAVKEIGSGVNDSRQKLISLLKKSTFDILLIEHKDRLTRFGFNYIKTLMEFDGRSVEVINEAETQKSDLIQDMVSVLYSFSARLYGKRKIKRDRITNLITQLP